MASPQSFPFPNADAAAFSPAEAERAREMAEVQELIAQLGDSNLRENALFLLSKKRESIHDLAPMLWNSFGTIAALLQDIISVYPALIPPTITPSESNRICNALALLQCVASHPDTRPYFISAHIPPYLLPFLQPKVKTRPLEYLRLTSLGVLGALVKTDDKEVVAYLLTTELIPLCLGTMETGSELSKTVATFIVQKMILDDAGLKHTCSSADRFYAVSHVLRNMIVQPTEQPSARLLKHIIRCYLRLTDDARGRLGVKACLSDVLRDETFKNCLHDDPVARQWLQQLIRNIS